MTPIEKIISDLFSEVLNCRQLEPQSDFFDLGGDSLTAARFMSRIRATFGLRWGIDVLFEFPTIAEFAERISQASADRIGH
jgi:acyl carrier protein